MLCCLYIIHNVFNCHRFIVKNTIIPRLPNRPHNHVPNDLLPSLKLVYELQGILKSYFFYLLARTNPMPIANFSKKHSRKCLKKSWKSTCRASSQIYQTWLKHCLSGKCNRWVDVILKSFPNPLKNFTTWTFTNIRTIINPPHELFQKTSITNINISIIINLSYIRSIRI